MQLNHPSVIATKFGLRRIGNEHFDDLVAPDGVVVFRAFGKAQVYTATPSAYRLDSHAYVRWINGTAMLLSPHVRRQVAIHLSYLSVDLPEMIARSRIVGAFLHDHGFAVIEGEERPLDQWTFHDALMHGAASLARGITDQAYGAIWPGLAAGIAPAPWRQDLTDAEHAIELPKSPRATAACSRRTIRRFASTGFGISDLGSLLHDSLRTEGVIRHASGDVEVFHPYASGGARGEISVFVATMAVEGLAPGLYAYRSLEGVLAPVPAGDEDASLIVRTLAPVVSAEGEPSVAILLVADYARMSWKYATISYATILRNVGAAYQAVSVAAHRLGLAACPCGGGWAGLADRLRPSLNGEIVGAVLVGARMSEPRDA